jgi:hypothetical protein
VYVQGASLKTVAALLIEAFQLPDHQGEWMHTSHRCARKGEAATSLVRAEGEAAVHGAPGDQSQAQLAQI